MQGAPTCQYVSSRRALPGAAYAVQSIARRSASQPRSQLATPRSEGVGPECAPTANGGGLYPDGGRRTLQQITIESAARHASCTSTGTQPGSYSTAPC
jgi:hypothetical protein